MQTAVVRPSPAMFVVGVLVASGIGNGLAAGRAPVVHGLLAGALVLAFLAVAGHHRVEVGETVRAVTWWSTAEVLRSRIDAVRRGGQGRPTRLTTADGYEDDDPVTIPTFVAPRRVARALEVPLLTPYGDVVERRAELRALAWVLGGLVLFLVVVLLLATAG